MLSSLKLFFTETGEINLPVAAVTIFVGPNNSGKSLILREIEQALISHPFPQGTHILKDYEIAWPTAENINAEIKRRSNNKNNQFPAGEIELSRINPVGQREAMRVNQKALDDIGRARVDKNWWATHFLKWGMVRLDGRSRFNLTNDQQGGDLLEPPNNVLAHLFQKDEARLNIRSLIKEAFDLNFVIDPTRLGTLRIKLSIDNPLEDEQSLNEKAREFHKRAVHIKDASDGVQAFTGILTAVCSGDFHTILIDEPEAFLHPPLARKLGKNLATLAAKNGGILMASTHSSDFLMGCIQASPAVRVVRLEFSSGKSRGRMINPEALEIFFRHPLMRSSNVISGLFHDGVIVVESDNDRVFYSEIYHRISEGKSDYPSILFVNAQNKQTVKDIIGPMRQFGVPAAAILDIDFVKDGGKTWIDWLKSAQIPDALHIGYGQQRAAIYEAFSDTGKNMKTGGGLKLLQGQHREAAEQLFETLEQYGIFPVRGGELENWLESLQVSGKKTDWTISMLERLGIDPSDKDYIRPSKDDVWSFIEKIVSWIRNSSRKGVA